MKRLTSENQHLKKVLEMEKDKVHTLEASMEKLFQKGNVILKIIFLVFCNLKYKKNVSNFIVKFL